MSTENEPAGSVRYLSREDSLLFSELLDARARMPRAGARRHNADMDTDGSVIRGAFFGLLAVLPFWFGLVSMFMWALPH